MKYKNLHQFNKDWENINIEESYGIKPDEEMYHLNDDDVNNYVGCDSSMSRNSI